MKENYDDSLFLQNDKIIGYVIDSELITHESYKEFLL